MSWYGVDTELKPAEAREGRLKTGNGRAVALCGPEVSSRFCAKRPPHTAPLHSLLTYSHPLAHNENPS